MSPYRVVLPSSWPALGELDIPIYTSCKHLCRASKQLLKLAVPLVQKHGFTRQALALSALSLPNPHTEPLSDAAVSSLFGQGDDARRTLITAWQDDARERMATVPAPTVREVLRARLACNEPVLPYLPEVHLALLPLEVSGTA